MLLKENDEILTVYVRFFSLEAYESNVVVVVVVSVVVVVVAVVVVVVVVVLDDVYQILSIITLTFSILFFSFPPSSFT